MALDPLRFAIEIADEASQKIKAIKEELNKLEPKIKVTFDESSINVAQLRTALENAIKSLGEIKVSGAGINISGDALGGAAEKITEAKEAIKGGRFGELAKRINETTTELERLTRAFETFQLTIGKDKGLKDFMTGLGEVISNVKTQLGALDKVSNSETSLTKTAEKVETNRRKFNELIEAAGKLKTELKSVNIDAVGAGFDNPVLKNALRNIDEYINGLRRMREEGKVDFSSNHQISEMVAGFNRLKSALSDVGQWQSKLTKSAISEGLRADAQSAAEATRLFAQWSESIRRASVEYTDLGIKIAQLSDKEKAASAVGVDTTKLKDQINALKVYRDTLKEISDGSRKHGTAQEFVRRADYETAIKLAQREGDVVMQTARERARADKQLEQSIKQAEDNQNRFNRALFEAQEMMKRLTSASSTGAGLNLGTGEIDRAIIKLRQYIDQLLLMDAAQFNATGMAGWKNLSQQLAVVAREQEKLNKATDTANQKSTAEATRQQAQAAKQAQTDTEKWAESMRVASIEATKLEREIRELKKVEKKGSDLGIDTTNLKSRISQLEQMAQILRSIEAGMRIHGTASSYINSADFKNAVLLANEEKTAIAAATREKEKAASATSQLTAEEQRLAQALNQTTEHARGQSQVLSDLKSMAMQYLGVWGGQQFLRNIIEIGGQLEMQRLSIGAILQNQSQANDLFERIKGLAVQSPFGVVELDQMTKQLTAYGFKYNELFDMTKRLADISAATGTGVDRLALALGHVRSEAALSGYTLRQFSMANVPLLQKLSEKLGKTTQEIRKMVRAKEVSYEDVIGVLQDITNEGGMFYNMQEVISQSVKAKFKNVKDAMDIMYGEMAEGYIGDSLKGVADALMEVTRNWKDAATVLGTGAALWAAQRVAVMAYTSMLGKNNAAILSSIATFRQQEVMVLRQASLYRTLSLAEKEVILTSQKRTSIARAMLALHIPMTDAMKTRIALANKQRVSDIAAAFASKKLKVEDLARQVALGRVTKEEAKSIISKNMMAGATRNAALATIDGTKVLGFWGKAALMASGAAISLSRAVMSIFPQAALMAGVTALVELWQRNSREMERSKEIADSIYERSQEALKNTRTMMQETDIKTYWRKDEKSDWSDVSSNFGGQVGGQRKVVLPELDTSNAQESIEKWSQYIREYAATPNKILNDALFESKENVRSLEEQFDNLKHKVVEVADAQVLLQGLGTAFEDAINKTNGGWLDDDLITNIEDYNKSLKEFGKNVSSVYKAYRKSVDTAIKIARQQDAQFDSAVQSMGSYSQQLEYLVKNQDEYTKAVEAFKNAGGANAFSELNESGNILQNKYYKTTFDEVQSQQKTMEADMNRFFVEMDDELERKGYKIGQMTVAQQQAVLLGFKTQFEGLKLSSQETLDYLMGLVSQHYGIELDVKDELFRAKVDEATRLLNGLINGEWKVDLNFATNINDVIDKARKNYKTAKEYFENAKPIMMKFGVNASFGKEIPMMKMTEILNGIKDKGARDFVEQVMNGWNEAAKAIQQSIDASTKGGFSLEDPNKSKKNKSKSGSKKAYKDEVAAEWRERIKLLKDANSLYKEWNKRSGEDAALSRVRQQYGDIFEKWRTDKNLPWKDFKAEDIIEYRSYIQKIVDEAQTRYNSQRNDKAKNYGKEAEAVLREGKKLLDDIDKYDFDEKAKDFTAAATKTIDQLSKRWEIFKSAVDTTGDALLAAQLAGFGDTEQGARTAAEAMRNELINQLNKLGGADLVAKIPLNIDLNEEEVRDKFLGAIPNADKVEDYKRSIDALIKLYQEWQKLQQKANTDDINTYTKIIGLANSYDAQVKKINKDLQEQLASISANPLLSESQKSKGSRMAQASADWKKMKLSADYANLHNRAVAMSAEEYERAEIALRNMIERLRQLGLLSPEEDISETNALNKAAKERRQDTNGALGHFITGGQQGLRDYYQRIADAALENRSRYTAGSAEWKKADAEYKKNKEKADAIDDEIASIQATQAALENLQKAASLLSDFFTAIAGESGEGAALGSISGGALSGASALSGFGPWGMAAGAILGGATAMIQEGDKAAERAIQELRGDVQAIESNTEEILRLRERTLGYDSGKYLADLYKNQAALVSEYFANPFDSKEAEKSFHASWGASIMSDWYKELYGGASSGYEAQYNNLIEQRKNYLAILDEQNEKKHKSDEEIAETKSKIAELDDQIMNFSQDLAKELWGIDIKGWADQLSDALASAFENGENMAKAYRDTVTSIIQQMMQKMMQMAIIEPMFERLQKQLFGENGKGGVFDPNNPKGSMSKVTKIIGDYFGKGGEGEKTITASMEFMTAFQRGMQNAGLTVLNEASNTLSSGIQGTSEETSDLLAGYVNALRQDVSVNRILLTQYVTQLWPQYIEAYTAQVTSVSNIDNNVRIIMEMMQLGNGAMYDQIAAMRTRIDNIVLGIDRVSVR